jgi:hypothetical protein
MDHVLAGLWRYYILQSVFLHFMFCVQIGIYDVFYTWNWLTNMQAPCWHDRIVRWQCALKHECVDFRDANESHSVGIGGHNVCIDWWPYHGQYAGASARRDNNIGGCNQSQENGFWVSLYLSILYWWMITWHWHIISRWIVFEWKGICLRKWYWGCGGIEVVKTFVLFIRWA